MTSNSPNPRLRIAVVAHALRQGGGLSAGRSLVTSLATGSSHTYLFTLPDLPAYRSIPIDPARHRVVFYRRRGGVLGRWMYDTFRLEKVIRRFEPDRILALGNRGIHDPPCPQAVFSRDAHMFYPAAHYGNENLSDKLKLAYQRWRFIRDLRHTDLVFCQTEVARQRLREVREYQGEIAISGNAISPETLAGGEQAEDLGGRGVGLLGRFAPDADLRLLCLGSYYPHKNLEAVVDMFERHADDLAGVVVVITISAEQHANARRLLDRIRKSGMEEQIVNLGPLTQEEIAGAYATSHALLLPTLLESFSRTYLEAMHFGVPILTSDLDFARVICGDAALYFDPFEPAAIVAAVRRLRSDSDLATALVENGRKRLKETRQSWDQIAAGMLREVEAMTGSA